MKVRTQVVLVMALITALLASAPGGVSAQQAPEANSPKSRVDVPPGLDRDSATEVREALGFRGSDTGALMANPTALRNFEEKGYLLTNAEYAQFAVRSELGDRVAETLPEIAEIPGFAGAELVHENDGVFRIYTSERKRIGQVRSALAKAKIVHGRVEIVVVPFSEDELLADMELAWRLIEKAGLSNQIVSMSLQNNRQGIEVGVEQTVSRRFRAEVSRALRNKIASSFTLVDDEQSEDAACPNRKECADPTMAGAIVKRPPHLGTLASRCTMGFHVRHGNDEQFLTSGHCSYEQRSDAWYFPGTPEYQPENFLGDMQQTLYGTTDPGPVNPVSTSRDVMRVQMPDDQVSDDIYAVTSDISGYLNTAQIYNGLPVCKSGITTYVTCGTIYKKFHSYTSSSCGCLNFGTRATIKADLGDSGAPVYHQVIFGGQIEGTYAVGIQATRSSKVTRRSNFVRIQDALSGLNVTLVT